MRLGHHEQLRQPFGRERAQMRGVDALRHEQRIDAHAAGTLDIRIRTVTDGEGAADFAAGAFCSLRERGLIDGRMRLAVVDDRAADLLVGFGERTCAPDQLVSTLDYDVWIGAEHRQPAYP